jgi:hypothetical protein
MRVKDGGTYSQEQIANKLSSWTRQSEDELISDVHPEGT